MTGPGTAGGYTVAGLAVQTGITTSGVRYYLRQGLLHGIRDHRGQWSLEPSSAARVRFIRSAQDQGLTLLEVAALLDPVHGEANRLDRAAEIERQVGELRVWRDVLLEGAVGATECYHSDEFEGVLCS